LIMRGRSVSSEPVLARSLWPQSDSRAPSDVFGPLFSRNPAGCTVAVAAGCGCGQSLLQPLHQADIRTSPAIPGFVFTRLLPGEMGQKSRSPGPGRVTQRIQSFRISDPQLRDRLLTNCDSGGQLSWYRTLVQGRVQVQHQCSVLSCQKSSARDLVPGRSPWHSPIAMYPAGSSGYQGTMTL
jgi:hypothetical protein